MTDTPAPDPLVPTTRSEVLPLVLGAILPGFNGVELPPWLRAALRGGLGGVVYFRQNIDFASPGQPGRLSAEIRSLNPDAVIALDEEGGNVTRLQSPTGSAVPGAQVLGRLDDVALTEAAGRALGRLCRAAGANLTFAPVADVNTNPANPVIGVRSFGADTALVARHTAAAVRGIQSTGVGACAKHFPGHGDTVTDSHVALPRVDLSLAQLESAHLPPFRAAAEAGVQAMMSAHIVVPELGEAPATLNPAAGALLRGLGFEGMLVTDALDMAAIRGSVGSGAGAVQALLAGADLLCVGNPANVGYTDPGAGADEGDFLEVRDAVVAAVEDGSLALEVLRRAARRRAAFLAWTRAGPRGRAGAGQEWPPPPGGPPPHPPRGTPPLPPGH
ncbi:MAG: glycoside hydrolase family 3 protein, partial [Actinomycetales bacterium]